MALFPILLRSTEATGKFTLAFTTTTHLLWSYLSLLVLGSDHFYFNLRLTLLMVTAQRYCEAMLLFALFSAPSLLILSIRINV